MKCQKGPLCRKGVVRAPDKEDHKKIHCHWFYPCLPQIKVCPLKNVNLIVLHNLDTTHQCLADFYTVEQSSLIDQIKTRLRKNRLNKCRIKVITDFLLEHCQCFPCRSVDNLTYNAQELKCVHDGHGSFLNESERKNWSHPVTFIRSF